MLKNFKEKLSSNYKINNSILCIGLDPDLNLMPVSDITKFNKIIIDSTKNFACAYKPNLSFYEALGSLGIKALENTIDYIRETAPDKLIIGDGKRGDIGSTNEKYVEAFFEYWGFDAITVNPFAGQDSFEPFIEYSFPLGSAVVFMAATSDPPLASDIAKAPIFSPEATLGK